MEILYIMTVGFLCFVLVLYWFLLLCNLWLSVKEEKKHLINLVENVKQSSLDVSAKQMINPIWSAFEVKSSFPFALFLFLFKLISLSCRHLKSARSCWVFIYEATMSFYVHKLG